RSRYSACSGVSLRSMRCRERYSIGPARSSARRAVGLDAEALAEQLGGLLARVGRVQEDDAQPDPVSLRRGHQAMAGGDRVPGLQAVDPRVALDDQGI